MQSFTPRDLEALRVISLEGARSARQALRQLTGLPVELEVRRVQTVPFADVPSLLGGDEAPVVGLHLKVYGDFRANVLLALPPDTALRMVAALFPPGPESLEAMGEIERSGLAELGNIVTCAYLNALSAGLHRSLIPSVPALAHDMAGAVVDVLLIEMGQRGDDALIIMAEISSGPDLKGFLLLMPDPASLPGILSSLRGAPGRAGT